MSSESNIGFVSTRLSGTDGVSLEVAKWVHVLNKLGHQCFFFAGDSEWPDDRSYVVPEAHFNHPEISELNTNLFDATVRSTQSSLKVEKIKDYLKDHLHKFTQKFDLDIMIIENALSLPMNVPLGLALTELIAEMEIPIIAHHHDFHWERPRFAVSAAEDYLRTAFPPSIRRIKHVVINSFAARQVALRTGETITLIPNVMDFDSSPPPPDDYADKLRSELEIQPDEFILLQPTRIVPRKRIERAIELSRQLDCRCVVVISHSSGDEGKRYEQYLRDYADLLDVKVLFAAERFAAKRDMTRDGRKIYSLADAYRMSSIVTYPSFVEGFGNAFLETIYYKRPIVMSTYEIFKTDISPKGFKVIGFKDFIDSDCIRVTRKILDNPGFATEMVEHNYEVARRHYSYRMLENRLDAVMNEALGLE